MKRHRRTKKRRKIVRMWTHPEALAAVPYIRSIVRSIREHFTEVMFCERTLAQLSERSGRPDRATLIAQQAAETELHRQRQRLSEATNELESLGVNCIDPAKGIASIPFLNDDRLAWYLFDWFDPKPLRFWRYAEDPKDTRRPIAAMDGTT